MVFLFAVVSSASIFALISSRQASAESFLLNTVRCTVRTLLAAECAKPSTGSVTPVSPSTAPSPAATPTPSSEQPMNTQATSPAQQSVQGGAGVAGSSPAMGIQGMAPLTPEEAGVQEVERPVATRILHTYTGPSIQLAAMPLEAFGGRTVAEPSPVLATSEGWHFFGIAWYWVLLVGGVITGAAVLFRRGIFKNPFSVVKREVR